MKSLHLLSGIRERLAGVYYGWRMIGIVSAMRVLGGGLHQYGFTVFFLPVTQDLGLTRASTALAFSLARAEGSLVSPVVGYLIDRYGPKPMMFTAKRFQSASASPPGSGFPYAVVGFMVIYPKPAVTVAHLAATIGTLERLGGRTLVDESEHRAEAMSLFIWAPDDGTIDAEIPPAGSPLRIEAFSGHVERTYVARYKGLPPHAD